jgi:hypothetical protein
MGFRTSEQELDNKNRFDCDKRKAVEHKSGGTTPNDSVKPSKQVDVTNEPTLALPIVLAVSVPPIAIPKNDAPHQPQGLTDDASACGSDFSYEADYGTEPVPVYIRDDFIAPSPATLDALNGAVEPRRESRSVEEILREYCEVMGVEINSDDSSETTERKEREQRHLQHDMLGIRDDFDENDPWGDQYLDECENERRFF